MRAAVSDMMGYFELKIKCYVDNKSLVDALYSKKSADYCKLRN